MADTIALIEGDFAGFTEPRLKVFAMYAGTGAAALNNSGTGDLLTAVANRSSEWIATISESLTGVYKFEVWSGSVMVAYGYIRLVDDENIHKGCPNRWEAEHGDALATLLTRTARVDAMLETSGSTERFKESALNYAINSGLDAAGIRTAIGLTSANLNTQLAAILAKIATAADIEAALTNASDGTDLLQLIADKLAGDLSTTDLTTVAIATACRDAIFDRVLAGNHDDAGSAGKLLQTFASQINTLNTLIGNGQIATVSHQLPNEWIVLVRGDTYAASNGRVLKWVNATGANWPADLTGAVIRFSAVAITDEDTAIASVASNKKIEAFGTVAQATSPNQEVRCELTSSDTDKLIGTYRYDLEATMSNGDKHTLVTTAEQQITSTLAALNARKPKKYLEILPSYSHALSPS